MIDTGVEDCNEKRRSSPNALLFLYQLHLVERVKAAEAASIRLRAFGFSYSAAAQRVAVVYFETTTTLTDQ